MASRRYSGISLMLLTMMISLTRGQPMDITDALFEDYNRNIRPYPDQMDPVDVDVEITVQHVSGLDTAKQELESTIMLMSQWTDKRLEFVRLTKTNHLVVGESLVWAPNLHIKNLVGPAIRLYGGRVVIAPDGMVMKYEYVNVKTSCSFQNETVQTCNYVVADLYEDGTDINLRKMSCAKDELEGREWRIDHTNAERNVIMYPCCPNPYPEVSCALTLSRIENKEGTAHQEITSSDVQFIQNCDNKKEMAHSSSGMQFIPKYIGCVAAFVMSLY